MTSKEREDYLFEAHRRIEAVKALSVKPVVWVSHTLAQNLFGSLEKIDRIYDGYQEEWTQFSSLLDRMIEKCEFQKMELEAKRRN